MRSTRQRSKPRRRFGLLILAVGIGLLISGQEDCIADPPPSMSRHPLALDCVIAGSNIYIPLEPIAAPDRPFLTAGTGSYVDVSLTARLPYVFFCALNDAGISQADLGSATVTVNIAGVSKPIPPEVVLPATGLPIPAIDTALACGGSLGAEVPLDFPPVTSIPWADGAWTVDFLLTVSGIDIQLTSLLPAGPNQSLTALCEPTDKTVPSNGMTNDLEDSPRIAADRNGDGIYEAVATAQDQIQLNVNGFCVGYRCDDFNDCTIDTCDVQSRWCYYADEPDGTSCQEGSDSGICAAGVCNPVHPCTEQGLRDAIAAGGGPRRFDCAGPTTIVTQADVLIDRDVVLDGGRNLTIDGGQVAQLIVDAGVTVGLRGISVTNGAGVINHGTLTIEDSAVMNNNVGSANGGGIYNSETGTLTVTRSLVSGNVTDLAGGGVANRGETTIVNSTISSNSAASGGGIAQSVIATGIVEIISSTIANNTAPAGSAIANNGTMTVANTLVEGSCSGVVTSIDYNIESPGDTCGLADPSDQVSVAAGDLNLGPLADNGGPTMTHELLPGSVAMDAVSGALCVGSDGAPLGGDQRGAIRPQAFICDVGAFEYERAWSSPDGNAGGENFAMSPTGSAVMMSYTQTYVPPSGSGWPYGTYYQSVLANHFTPELGWSGPTEQFTSSGSRFPGTTRLGPVAFDLGGNAIATWARSGDPNTYIIAGRFVPSVGWGGSTVGQWAHTQYSMSLAVSLDGNALAVWDEQASASLKSNRFTPGVGWGSSWDRVDDGEISGWERDPIVALGETGEGIAIWTHSGGGTTTVQSGRFDPNTGWQQPELFLDAGSDYQVAMDPAGVAIAVWLQDDGGLLSIWSKRHTIAAGWGTAELVETNDIDTAGAPMLIMDASGNALAVWVQGDRVWSNRLIAGGGWGQPERVGEDGSHSESGVRLAANPDGGAYAFWDRNDGGAWSLRWNRFAPTAGWAKPELLQDVPCVTHAGLDVEGNVLVICGDSSQHYR